MNQDVRIDLENKKFKFRVCGIVEQDGKFLLVRIQDNDFYCLPGGHVEIGENTEDAVLREMKEETGYDLKIDKLISITENFFAKDDVKFHEIAYYYIMNPIEKVETVNRTVIENDKGEEKTLEFYWWDINEVAPLEVMPKYIANKMKNKNYELENVIIED